MATEIPKTELDKIHKQLNNFLRQITMKTPKSQTIIYCQATYDQDYQDTLKCVERVSPYMDYTIIVEDGTLTLEQKQKLESYPNVKVKTVEFKDNLPEYRNAYLEEAKKIDPYAWILVSDPDELFSESLMKDIRLIVAELEKNGYNMAGINCHEYFEHVEWLDKLDLLKETPGGYRESNFWKNLLFKLSPHLRYQGVGKSKTVHETWYSPDMPWVPVNLPKEYWYEHRKSALKIWRNAARNVFMGGGGDNLGDLIPQWRELRQICNELGITSWRQYEEHIKKGNINPKLKNFLIKCLSLPATNWGTEYREMAKWYFALHKNEVTPEILEKIKAPPPMPKQSEIEAYVTQCYFKILGRHPDEQGKAFYTKAIMEGKMPKEALPQMLMNSQEYKQKFLSTLTPEQLRFSQKWEAYLAIQKKAETEGRGLDKQPPQATQHYIQEIVKHIPPEKYPKLLDIGAGTGEETKALVDAGYQVIGITFGKDNIAYAQRDFKVKLLEMDMHNLTLSPKLFDAVIMIHTFEHALAPHIVIGETRYVLRDGGRVYLAVPDPDKLESKTIWHTNLLNRKQIIDLFKYWGFKLLGSTESEAREKWEFIFEKLPDNHPDFKHNWGYIQHIYQRRP